MGAKDKNVNKISFRMMSGDRSSEVIEWAVEDGLAATLCSISPIWHVTAVHGRAPMNVPRKQSAIETPQTPHAILRPDHGTTPIKRRTESRTQTGVLSREVEFESESPCSAFLVTARARGNH